MAATIVLDCHQLTGLPGFYYLKASVSLAGSEVLGFVKAAIFPAGGAVPSAGDIMESGIALFQRQDGDWEASNFQPPAGTSAPYKAKSAISYTTNVGSSSVDVTQ